MESIYYFYSFASFIVTLLVYYCIIRPIYNEIKNQRAAEASKKLKDENMISLIKKEMAYYKKDFDKTQLEMGTRNVKNAPKYRKPKNVKPPQPKVDIWARLLSREEYAKATNIKCKWNDGMYDDEGRGAYCIFCYGDDVPNVCGRIQSRYEDYVKEFKKRTTHNDALFIMMQPDK